MKKLNLNSKFSSFVLKGRWIFLLVFVVLTIFGAIMIPLTPILYDLSAYAPKGSNTEKAVQILQTEFDDKGSAYIMIKNISLEDAYVLSDEIKILKGVASVTFDEKKDYKNNSVFYTVLLTDYDASEECNATIKGIIKSLDDEDAYFIGQSASSYYTRQETFDSILKVGIVIAIIVLAMLLFTSKTYFELVVMLIVFGASIIINVGTNFIFNGISYVANLVSLILQLALSIDYSVILLHRYMEERENNDAKTAVKNALTKGITEILSSSLTTLAGLCTLMFMALPIGVELGQSLAKSIAISLFAVIFFMPALLVLFDKPLEKSKHKNFVPSVERPARAILKQRKAIVVVFIVLILFSGTGHFFNKYTFNMNSSSHYIKAHEQVAEEFGTINDLVIIVPKGDYAKEKALTEYVLEKGIVNSAMGLSNVEVAEGVYLTDKVNIAETVAFGSALGLNEFFATSLFNMYIDAYDPSSLVPVAEYRIMLIDLLEFAYQKVNDLNLQSYAKQLEPLVSARAKLESEGYSRIMFNINSDVESKESLALIRDLLSELNQFYDEFYLAGESVACYDMVKIFPRDNMIVSILTVLFVLIILLFTFKKLALPIILILVIQGGIWINFSIPFLMGTPVLFIGYLLICAVQMGATIDYAIILTNRFTTLKHSIPDKLEAMAKAENAVYPTIITSGTILIVTGFALDLMSSGVVAQIGRFLGVGTLISVLLVLFVLPSLLIVCDKIIDKSKVSRIIKKMHNSNLRAYQKRKEKKEKNLK